VLGGVVAAVQMILFVTVAGAARPGYDAGRNWISQLSLGPGGWLAAINLAACGGWLLVCAAGLRGRLADSTAGRWAVRLVRWCGVCLVVLAVVPIDPGLGYPPGVAAVHTVPGAVHQAVALVLAIAGTAAAVLLGRCSRAVLPWAPPAGLTVSAIMAVSFVGATVLVKLDEAGVLPGTPSGLLERVALYAGLAWIGVVGAAHYGLRARPQNW
jgi:hypothetical protein